MLLSSWEELPKKMQNDAVKAYYENLQTKKASLLGKMLFDKVMALFLLIIFAPLFLVIAIWIKIDSEGEIFFRQIRITQYGKQFRIYKFRTMVKNAEAIGTQVTTQHDRRITKLGGLLRKYRIDEIPQLLNIVKGEMSFVGTRPEVAKYVEHYTDEMLATLLLPAGVTSEASIMYKDEEQLLTGSENADEAYINEILPAKMQWNLASLKNFSLASEIKMMIKTVIAVF